MGQNYNYNHNRNNYRSVNRQSGNRYTSHRSSQRLVNTRQYSRTAPTYRHANVRKPKGRIAIVVILVLILLGALGFVLYNQFFKAEQPGEEPAPFVEPKMTNDIIISLHGDKNTQLLKGEDYIESGANAIDKKDGVIANSIKTEGSVDKNKAGTYTITYTATNSKGEIAKAERQVKVLDSMDKDTDGISVMMYHYVYDDAAPPAQLNSNFLPASKFEAQLKWLKENGYYYPSYKELRAYIEGKHSLPKKSVILTFDDGEEGFLNYGGALLKKYEIPATSFIIGDLPQTPDNLIKYANPYIDYQSHTYSLHVDGTSGKGHGGKIFDLNAQQQMDDFAKCAQLVGSNDALAYPFGDCDENSVVACQKNNILCAFTVDYNQVKPGDNPAKLSRMRIFGTGSLDSFVFQVENGVG